MSTDTSSVASGSTAPYDAWATPAVFSSETVQATTVELEALASAESEGTPTPTQSGTQGPTDPVVGLALRFAIGAAFSGFALASFGVGDAVSEGGPSERIHVVGNALVFEGSYDVDSLGSTIEESQGSESGTYDGYTLYSSGSEDEPALAVSGDSLVTVASEVEDAQAVVEAAIDAKAGDAPAYSAEQDAYADLTTVLDSREITGLAYSPDGPINAGTPTPTPTPSAGGGSDFFDIGEFVPDGDVRGYAVGLSTTDSETGTAQIAFRFSDPSQVGDVDELASQVAPNAMDVSTTSAGAIVRVTATYTEQSTL